MDEPNGRQNTISAVLTLLCLVSLLSAAVFSGIPGQVSLVIAFAAGGIPCALSALRSLADRQVGVDLLMLVAAAGSVAIGEPMDGGVLLFLFSLSNTLEEIVLGRSRRAIRALMNLRPATARAQRDGIWVEVPAESLQVGERILVLPGERVPADGKIVSGETSIDLAAFTGESEPQDRTIGGFVPAGGVNLQGAVELEVTAAAADTQLARIIHLVETAQNTKAGSQRLTEWMGSRYAVSVLAGACLFWGLLLALGIEPSAAAYRAMTVLVVASPCAAVISVPAALLSTVARSARSGILFKGGVSIELLASVRAAALDKTGTLTLGRPMVREIIAVPGSSEPEVLRAAASAESRSEHPLARAVVGYAAEHGIAFSEPENARAVTAQGVEATVDGVVVRVGKPHFAGDGVEALEARAAELGQAGCTVVYVGRSGVCIGCIAVSDTLRPGAAAAAAELKALDVHCEMLTGDNERVARAFASEVGIDFRAGMLPEDKVEAVRDLKERYGCTAMVGDGMNDAPSLAAADLGISIGRGGTDLALETADIVLMSEDLRRLPTAVHLSRAAMRIVRQNLSMAFGVMAVLLLFAVAGKLRLPFAVIGHEGSTLLVVLNGLRLLGYRDPYAPTPTNLPNRRSTLPEIS
jgi:Cd2+/Zn2+-exporting ATPase